ncbi:platelet endothelial cell adhesion molecule-like [Rhinoraja longicauda]
MSKTAILFLVQLLYGIGHFQTDMTIHSVKIKSKPETSAKAGSSITLTCSVYIVARSGLPNQFLYRFYKGSSKNFLLNTSMTSDQEYSFTIQSARASHTGYYLCDARVANVTTTSEILHIKVTGQLQRPRLTIQSTTVIVGNEIELRCNAPEEIPPLDFTFYKDKNGQLSPAGHKGSNTNFVTYMIKVTETTNQIYSCKFKGRSLETYSNYSELVSIAVQDPFSSHLFTIEPQSQVFLGDNFTLRCRVQMSPFSASDTKYELTISKGSTLITQIVNGEAKISIKATAADEGLYSCIAKWKRTLKTIEKLVTVTVPVSKPSLKSTALNGIVAQGGRLSLTCAVVNGSSPIIYTFYKGTPGKPFHPIILNATAAVHLIYTADTADSGEYFCEAENNAGIKKRSQRSQNIAINIKDSTHVAVASVMTLVTALLLGACIIRSD